MHKCADSRAPVPGSDSDGELFVNKPAGDAGVCSPRWRSIELKDFNFKVQILPLGVAQLDGA